MGVIAGFGPSSKVIANCREEAVRQIVAPNIWDRGFTAPNAVVAPASAAVAGIPISQAVKLPAV